MSAVAPSVAAEETPAIGVFPFLLGAGQWVFSRRLRHSKTLSVWLGTDAETGRPVLARAFDLEHLSTGSLLRLEHEAEVISRIRQPEIVPVRFAGREAGKYWIVSEFLPGPSLRELLQTGERPSTLAALQITSHILAGLTELHARGIVHTAILPRSVLCGPSQTAGMLVWPGSLDAWSTDTPTPADLLELARYAAPEQNQVIHGEVGEAADLYAVGALLYRCLAGDTPHVAENLNQLLWQQATQPVSRLRQLGVDVPLALDEVLQRLLARDPGSRYQSAEAVRHDVAAILAALESGQTTVDLAIGGRDLRRSLTPPAFVARAAELATLDEQIERTHAGMPRLTMVEGLSGYGKSRLLAEFAVRCAQSGLTVFEGRAVQEISHPFQLLEGVAASFAAATHSRSTFAPRVRERLHDHLAPLVATLPSLAGVLMHHSNAAPVAVTESETLSALAEFLDALGSREHPAVVILDDCQWAHDLVYRLLLRWQVLQSQRPLGERHVQLVVAFRSDEVAATHPLRRIEPGAKVEIGPLSPADVQRLIESMAGPLPAAAVEVVTRFADGSPFMAAAILHGLVESRALVSEAHQWRVDPLALDEVRSSTHAAELLSKRLGLLEGDTRQLLQAGALLGTEFALEMAVHLTGLSAAQAWNAVNHARRRQLLWWSRHDGTCKFVHDKIREALRSSQSAEVTACFHLRAAEYLRIHATDRHADLAIHLAAAGQSDAALAHALIAAAEARRTHALELAEQQYRIAERAAGEADARVQFSIAEGLGDILMLRGKYTDAEQQFARAEQLAGDTLSRAEVFCRRGELLIKRGDMHAALEQFRQGLQAMRVRVPGSQWRISLCLMVEVVRQALHTVFRRWLVHRRRTEPSPQVRLTLRLYSGYSHAAWYCAKLPLLMWAHLRGMNRAERWQPSLELAQVYSDHAPGMILIPWHRRGLQYAQRSLAIREARQDLWGQGQSWHFYGIVQYAAGRYGEAIEACRRAVQILQKTGDYWQVHIARYQIAASLFHQGDLQGALEEAQHNHASGLMVGDEQASGIILDVWARAAPGRIPESILDAELRRERHDFQGQAQVLLAAGIQRLAQNRLTEALDALNRAQGIVNGAGVRNPYTTPVAVWRTTALRRLAEAERSLHPRRRRDYLRQANAHRAPLAHRVVLVSQ